MWFCYKVSEKILSKISWDYSSKHKRHPSAGSLLDKKIAEECHVLTEDRLDEIGARLEEISLKSLRRLAQETASQNHQQPQRQNCINFSHTR
jgi:hypothetical protein